MVLKGSYVRFVMVWGQNILPEKELRRRFWAVVVVMVVVGVGVGLGVGEGQKEEKGSRRQLRGDNPGSCIFPLLLFRVLTWA